MKEKMKNIIIDTKKAIKKMLYSICIFTISAISFIGIWSIALYLNELNNNYNLIIVMLCILSIPITGFVGVVFTEYFYNERS